MIDVIAKVAEVSAKAVEKLGSAVSSVKEIVVNLDKPLNSEKIDSLKDSGSKKSSLLDLDKPLTEKMGEYDEEGFRAATDEEKQGLKEKFNWTDKAIDKCKINDETKTIKYPCINDSLAGEVNPLTGVEYEKTTVENKGENIEVVRANFKSEFDAQLPEDKIEATDREQFKECNKQLAEAIEENPKLAESFTADQLEQIKDGVKNGGAPDGYTWHHDMESGKMQLVDSDMHADTRHTGGKALWGGGNENR